MSFEDDAAVAAPPNILETLSLWVQRIRAQQAVVDQCTQALELAQADLNKLVLVDVPDAMAEAGLTELKLTDGAQLAVKSDLKVSITKANEAAAYAWLKANGHGMSIKKEMNIDLRALEDAEIGSMVDVVRQDFDAEPSIKETIHSATLKSIVSHLLEEGKKAPDSISVHEFKRAVIKEPKQR